MLHNFFNPKATLEAINGMSRNKNKRLILHMLPDYADFFSKLGMRPYLFSNSFFVVDSCAFLSDCATILVLISSMEWNF